MAADAGGAGGGSGQRPGPPPPINGPAPHLTPNTWHVGTPTSHHEVEKTFANAPLPGAAPNSPPYGWEGLGVHLRSGAVPGRLRDRLNLPIARGASIDLDPKSASPDGGAAWSGAVEAERLIRVLDEAVRDDSLRRGLDASFPGAEQADRDSAEKAGRLDGLPIGSWADPRGYVSTLPWHAKRLKGEGDVEQIADEMRLWLRVCRSHRGLNALNPLYVASPPGTYAAPFLSVDVSKHKGWPCFTGGRSEPDAAAAALVGQALRDGLVDVPGVEAAAARHGQRLPLCSPQFIRRQAGRRVVPYLTFDAASNGPAPAGALEDWWPKVRDVWAESLLRAIALRKECGEVFDDMKASPMHAVRSDEVGRIAKALHQRGLVPKSFDFKNFDKQIGPNTLEALTRVMAETTKMPPHLAAVLATTRTTPILSATHAPGYGGFLYARDMAMMSGVPFTTLGDSLINGALMIRFLRRIGLTDKQIIDGCGKTWFRLVAGDDTVVWLSPEWWRKYEDALLRTPADAGHDVATLPGLSYLSRQYNPVTGASIVTGATLLRNAPFKEEKRRPLLKAMAAYSVQSALALIRRGDGLGTVAHPHADVLTRYMQRLLPDAVEAALTNRPETLLAMARAEAKGDARLLASIDEEVAQAEIARTRDADKVQRPNRVPINRLVQRGTQMFTNWNSALHYLVERGNETNTR